MAHHSPKVLLVATMDTKHAEVDFVRSLLEEADVEVILMDAGIRGRSPLPVTITREQVAGAAGKRLSEIQKIPHEGEALAAMISGAVKLALEASARGEVWGIIGIGGSMGTTLGTTVMRAFPLGIPKVMISTMASRDTHAFVGTKDIMMLHSVCDLSGLNRISRRVLHNGAMALAGMVAKPAPIDIGGDHLVVLSTLGTTEACVQNVRGKIEDRGLETVVFHTVGAGGQAMEELISAELPTAVVDISCHEIADHLFGGDYDAGPNRCSAALSAGIPTVMVPGNIDFLVAGPIEKALRRFPGRPHHVHNAAITVLRTTRDEMRILAGEVAKRCNAAVGPVKILAPMEGFSAFDSLQGPLPDAEARRIFLDTLSEALENPSVLSALPHHINDKAFSDAVADAVFELIGK